MSFLAPRVSPCSTFESPRAPARASSGSVAVPFGVMIALEVVTIGAGPVGARGGVPALPPHATTRRKGSENPANRPVMQGECIRAAHLFRERECAGRFGGF